VKAPSQPRIGRNERGQALVEFALVVGLFVFVIGGLFQVGIIMWSQNTITQVARDTARYAVTLSDSPCDAAGTRAEVGAAANRLALRASLAAYRDGTWANAEPIDLLGDEGVGVDWPTPPPMSDGTVWTANDCPPSDNALVWTVRIRINHVVPIFLPGLQALMPSCAGGGFCLQTETELRMEPKTR
jgi:hypothetical protein